MKRLDRLSEESSSSDNVHSEQEQSEYISSYGDRTNYLHAIKEDENEGLGSPLNKIHTYASEESDPKKVKLE